MRLDIPIVVERLVEEGMVDLSNVSTSYALYTDTDVLFMGHKVAANDGSSWLSPSGEPLPQQRKQQQQQQQLQQQQQQPHLDQPPMRPGAHGRGSGGTSRGTGGSIGSGSSIVSGSSSSSSSSGDISSCSIPATQLLMLGREKRQGVPWDTGVMLVNVDALRLARPALVRFGKEAGWDFPGWEQGLLQGRCQHGRVHPWMQCTGGGCYEYESAMGRVHRV